ncbi:hypothetical protein M378DRAFT_124962 [Amanita muscaria Koide BX008]|uniref:Expansin-like EG45 domain-containing protein n=1 Tax=Amanita muscaria (strain Koide BX008) TaxID=946122 RepID=A0A0C2XAR0_AMAMK|nr:hypothetical protein M378DRAFT_124962 [Amanita muscaria Koide BX008]
MHDRLVVVPSLLFLTSLTVSQWIDYPQTGLATLTHTPLPLDYIASCGCVPGSTHYPTAALSQLAYGSNNSYGPACGKCFSLTLIDPLVASPPFKPPVTTSVVVKIIDKCPFTNGGWCGATPHETNAGGASLNFDLSFPSVAIPDNFFPSNPKLYGYSDFGVWNVSYEEVSCASSWAGAHNSEALGSVQSLGTSACCPTDPLGTGTTCPSYSEQNATPPNTAGVNNASTVKMPNKFSIFVLLVLMGVSILSY